MGGFLKDATSNHLVNNFNNSKASTISRLIRSARSQRFCLMFLYGLAVPSCRVGLPRCRCGLSLFRCRSAAKVRACPDSGPTFGVSDVCQSGPGAEPAT